MENFVFHIAETRASLYGITRICYGKKKFIENIGILQLKVPLWSSSAKELKDVSPLRASSESAWSTGVPINHTNACDIFAFLRDEATPECLFFK